MPEKHPLKALHWEPFESLFGAIPARHKKSPEVGREIIPPPSITAIAPIGLNGDELIWALDLTQNPELPFGERAKRLGQGIRRAEATKKSLLTKGLIEEIWLGKTLLLAPAPTLFELFGVASPYKRNISLRHAFLVWVTERVIRHHPLVREVQLEYSVGDSNSTLDVMVFLKDGHRHAYEIILHASNIAATVGKLQGQGFTEIHLVCQDFDLKEAVWSRIRNLGFAPEFLATIRCTIFSALLQQRKLFTPRG